MLICMSGPQSTEELSGWRVAGNYGAWWAMPQRKGCVRELRAW